MLCTFTNVLSLGEGAGRRPGIEWLIEPYFTIGGILECASTRHPIPLLIPPSPRGNDAYRLSKNLRRYIIYTPQPPFLTSHF